MRKFSGGDLTFYKDLFDHTFNEGIIPQDIMATKSRPYLEIINREETKIELLELTCSETNCEQANNKKF